MNEGARQGCQRLDRSRRRGTKTPTPVKEAARCSSWGNASPAIRRSGLGRRETFGPPVMPYGAQDSVGRPRRESGEREPGTHAVRVHVFSNGWQKSIGRIARLLHREVARPRGDQRALARRKSVAPPDVGARMERRRTGSAGTGFTIRFSCARPVGDELAGSRDDGRRSRAWPVLLSPAGRSEVLDS